MKRCARCKIDKPVSEFNKHKLRKDGLANWCKICGALDCKIRYRKRSPLERRAYEISKKYGISIDDYIRMATEQNNRCAICNEEKPLCVDHNHSKQIGSAVRKLLCHGCNKLLGFAKENPETLRRAAKYLEEHE